MSHGYSCVNPEHKPLWTVDVREANYSAFNGGKRNRSAYSQVHCAACPTVWRTKALYVKTLPDTPRGA